MSNQTRTRLSELLNSNLMHGLIIAMVLCNGVVVGLRTETLPESHLWPYLLFFDNLTIGLLIAELMLRFTLSGPHFFKRGWNVFDAIILSVSVFAIVKDIQVLEALRIILLFRIIELIPSMEHVVEAIKRAVRGLMNAIILLMVIFYAFSVAATHLFDTMNSELFGNVGRSMFTLFQLMAFDDLGNTIRPLMAKEPLAWIFFVLFLLCTAFSILNLFVGILVQSMQDASNSLAKHKKAETAPETKTLPPAQP